MFQLLTVIFDTSCGTDLSSDKYDLRELTALPLCIGTANRGHLEDKMQSDKKNIFFQNFEKVYISQ